MRWGSCDVLKDLHELRIGILNALFYVLGYLYCKSEESKDNIKN